MSIVCLRGHKVVGCDAKREKVGPRELRSVMKEGKMDSFQSADLYLLRGEWKMSIALPTYLYIANFVTAGRSGCI